jgi:putative tryptophan/tyrosine transport system substrate-binding protein
MQRREFIGLLGGAAVFWPEAIQAQQAERVRRVGVLIARDADDDADVQPRVAALVQSLSALGWIEGRNLRLDIHRTKPTADDIRQHVVELVASAPDVVVTPGGTTLQPFLQASRTIPVVFMSAVDPVGSGLVESLAHPGGNATGFMQFDYSLTGKWLELLKQISPKTTRAAVIRDSSTGSGIGQFAVIQSVAPSVGIDVTPINARDAGEIERVIGAFARFPNGSLIMATGAAVQRHGDLIVALAARHRIPAIFAQRHFVERGGLISYGYDALATARLAAGYVDRILKGAKPADLPVQAPTKYELVINLKTAKALGLTVPATLLVRADEVIE